VWIDDRWLDVSVPEMGGEALVVPNVGAIVLDEAGERLLLQRRDKPGEPVQGLLEVPGGRWRAGEAPDRAVAREVEEETGVELVAPLWCSNASAAAIPARSPGRRLIPGGGQLPT
jgi:8-oxo-dGTP diphosphatase